MIRTAPFGDGAADCQRRELFAIAREQNISTDDKPSCSQVDQLRKHSLPNTFGACIEDVDFQPNHGLILGASPDGRVRRSHHIQRL